MSKRARRLGGALSVLALLSLVAAVLASAATGPPLVPKPGKVRLVGQSSPTPVAIGPTHVLAYVFSAKLTPTGASSSAGGQWLGMLIHSFGPVQNGQLGTTGCSVSTPKAAPGPPNRGGAPHRITCGASLPTVSVPSAGNHWILAWRLTYQHLSSPVSGASVHITANPGSAPIASASLCSSSCASVHVGRTTLTDAQAMAVVKTEATVVVSTTQNPGGEISGPIERLKALPHK
jgi:hypothetical protein